ncbi:YjbF family lipoprotein [Pseudodonghicola flavimaris]|uniref:YjbF family lipoprotein n=1 Tax=Pseudodonghicola flavimaris TaxID=3050036 RepID=A0ABT7EZG2_9RHOB|nr:YjbF family lipoprotein [Pseudodonghicola flavimaris]MDK3017754.1 YjbF family lipoprotein [Pseudodonghicola flavimaris]
MTKWPLILIALLCGCSRPAMPDLRQQITRAQIDAAGQPLLLVEIPALRNAATLAPRSRTGGVTTWRSRDDVSLSFRDGLVVATRRLGDDLMSAEIENSLRLLRGQTDAGYVPRFHSYLDGEYQTLFRSFQCRAGSRRPERIEVMGRPHASTRIEEECRGPDLRFTNIYWRGADGTIWKSRQWISPRVGYAEIERLHR